MGLYVTTVSTTTTIAVYAFIFFFIIEQTLTLERELSESQKHLQPLLIRTQLKVSRSIAPGTTEMINVRSNVGGFATIIVKKNNRNTLVNNDDNTDRGISGPSLISFSNRNANEVTKAKLHDSNKNRNRNSSSSTTSSDVMTENRNWTPFMESIRFAEPTNSKSLQIIDSFMKHVKNFDHTTSEKKYTEADTNDHHKLTHIAMATMKLPEPTMVRSHPVFVKNNLSLVKSKKRAKSLPQVDDDGIPVIEGIRVPDDEEDRKHIWRNARVIGGKLLPYEKGYKPPPVENLDNNFGEIFPKSSRAFHNSGNLGPYTKADNFQTVQQDVKEARGPFTIKDNEPAVRSGGPFFIKDNSRLSETRLADYIKQINDQRSQNDYFAGRARLESDIRRFQNFPNTPIIKRRMLQNSDEVRSDSVIDFENEKYRAPVFEYAHPELGIQPAKLVSNENDFQQRAVKVQYYVKDSNIKSLAFEPPLNSQEYFQKDLYYKTATYPYNYGYLKQVKKEPFWMKLPEQVRERFTNSLTAVGELTKPIIDPLIEASQKISRNLGLLKRNNNTIAQDKISFTAAPTTTVLLPALGLVVSGAALGIGTVAVGKYFDGNILNKSVNEIDPEHKKQLINKHKESHSYMQTDSEKDYNHRFRRSVRENFLNFYTYSTTERFTPNRIEKVKINSQPTEHIKFKKSVKSVYNSADLGAILQNIDQGSPKLVNFKFTDKLRKTNWSDTSCAKLMICNVMIYQNNDEIFFMEKRIETFLSSTHQLPGADIPQHIAEVTDAIRRRNCSQFICPKK